MSYLIEYDIHIYYNFNLKLKSVMTNRNVVFIDFLQKYDIIYHAGKYKLYMK